MQKKMTKDLGGAKIYLKRGISTNHTGAHKINNVLGQAPACKKMGKTRLIALKPEQVSMVLQLQLLQPLWGWRCVVFMGEEDTVRQALNV